jgi:hypothetical protein
MIWSYIEEEVIIFDEVVYSNYTISIISSNK